MTTPNAPATGDQVICADGELLGVVDATEGTHLRIRRPHERPETVWVNKRTIGASEAGVVRLLLDRDQFHDGVISLPPARQREFATLESLPWLLKRRREG